MPLPSRSSAGSAGWSTPATPGRARPSTEAASGADLFLAEASFQTRDHNPPDLHLTGADCGRTATAAGVGRLVLTHIPPWHDAAVAEAEARGEWSGRLDVARAGETYEV